MKFSKNKKLNGILTSIYEGLQELGIEDVTRYYNEFQNEIDYNIAQYGNLLVYYYSIRKLYEKNNYKGVEKMTDEELWKLYKMQVGKVTRIMLEKEV